MVWKSCGTATVWQTLQSMSIQMPCQATASQEVDSNGFRVGSRLLMLDLLSVRGMRNVQFRGAFW